MADFILGSLRGGQNDTDPSIALPDDQAVLCQNVEFVDSMLGERRLGTDGVDLPAFIADKDRVTFMHRHLPTSDETASEFWVLGVTGTSTAALARKTSTWQAQVTISDTPLLTGFAPYRWQAVSIHGKIHFTYDSNVDRLHVWDGTNMRRSGLAKPPAAPTAANQGAGAINTLRYYRVRYTVKSGATTLLRSEPSDVLSFDPTNAGAVRVTKPATISESETHWELEASTDNVNFYLLATTVVGTTTYDDSTADGAGYSGGTLSEDIGDYALIPSARYLTADDDRLIWAGSWEDDDLASRVGWTPVFGADGVGNDERFETDTDPYKDLDTYEHGPITGISDPVLGGIWVFKQHAIYKLTRTGLRTNSYDSDKYTEALGAIHGSVVTAVDETGQPCVYFLDYEQGPCRIGVGGIKRCGEDIRKTWEVLNVDATAVACSSMYYPLKKQVFWNIAVNNDNAPTKRIVLHTDKSRSFADGVRKGWTVWTGNIAKALCMCLYAENINDNTTRSRRLVPFIGLEGLGLVHRCDTGINDDGTAFEAKITTKPYWLKSVLQKFAVHAAAIIAKATSNASIDVKCLRDFELETTSTVPSISLSPTGTETNVIKFLDNLKGAELRVAQFQFVDVASPQARWELNQLCAREETGQSS